MKFSPDVQSLILERAEELVRQGLDEGDLVIGEADPNFTICIDRRPELCVCSVDIREGPLQGCTVFVGNKKRD